MVLMSKIFVFAAMWQWQNAAAGADGTPTTAPNATVGSSAGPPGHPHPQAPGELQDMLQMLDHHTAAAPFEDLNMFNTNFE